jgi:hypothetical protein
MNYSRTLVLAVAVGLLLVGCQRAAMPTATAVPAPTATVAPAVAASGQAALTVTGAVGGELTLTMDALKSLGVVQITAEHPKTGKQDYSGVRLSVLLDKAKPTAQASKVVLTGADGFTSEVAMADLTTCSDCLVAIGSDGKLSAAMPGLPSKAWAKDLVKLEVK